VSESVASAILLSPDDSVATMIQHVAVGSLVAVRQAEGPREEITRIGAKAEIPFGHKIALRALAIGDPVIRYGARIGRLTAPVTVGDHVHVHNLTSEFSVRQTATRAPPPQRTINAADLKDRVVRALATAGVPGNAAGNFAEHMVEAHLRGVETHGLRRLKPYLARIRSGAVDGAAEPHVEQVGSLLRVDGRNAIGHHVAGVAADAVATAADGLGTAVALVRNSNHFGFAGYYATRIARHDMVAVVTSIGQVCLGPDGALRLLLSNDPIALAAPLGNSAFFEFDMATSKTSRANIAIAAERGEPISPGLALDASGFPTTDAAEALAGVLLAAGDARGFAFVAALEVLTGVVTGGAYADLVASKEAAPNTPEGCAHFMLAISLDRALGSSAAQRRLVDFVERLSRLPVLEGAMLPRYPGKRRWELRAERLRDGVPLSLEDFGLLATLSGDAGRDGA